MIRRLSVCLVLGLAGPALRAHAATTGRSPTDAHLVVPATLVAEALTQPAPAWSYRYQRRNHPLDRVFATYTLALAVHLGDVTLAPAVVARVREALQSGREPPARGGLGGWSQGPWAWTLAFARKTPAVWAALDQDTRERVDLCLQALAVAGHFSVSDANDYRVMLDGDFNYGKHWNPNHSEGQLAAVLASAWAFGVDELDAFFIGFDYATFQGRLEAAGFTNVLACWNHTPQLRRVTMEGGEFLLGDATRGTGRGVRGVPFTYLGHRADAVSAIFAQRAAAFFPHPVKTEIEVTGRAERTSLLARGEGRDPLLSPYEGQPGMAYEFLTTNAMLGGSNFRSQLHYVYEGWMQLMATALAVDLVGAWPEAPEVTARIAVGSGDFLFKAQRGYRGFANGRVWAEDASTLTAVGGWRFARSWWTEVLAPRHAPALRLPAVAETWRRVGVQRGIPLYTSIAPVSLSAAPDAGLANGSAIQAAINRAPFGTVVQLPPGDFAVATELRLRSGVVLRGAGARATTLRFGVLPPAYRGVIVFGGAHGRGVAITGGLEQGSSRITVEENWGLPVGTAIMLTQRNDPRWMATDNPVDWDQPWVDRVVGQMVRIVGREHQVFVLDEPVRYHDFRAEQDPRYYVLTGRVEYAGAEDFAVEVAPDETGAGRFTFQFNLAENCWLRRVESRRTQRGHVNIMHGRDLEIRDNVFAGAHRPGSGRGMGVDLGLRSGNCLVEANTFEGLRHGLLLQSGANGNVLARNRIVAGLAGAADIAVRGHWTYLNLIEANDAGSIEVGGYWGPAGEGTTLLRNRVGLGGIVVADRSYRINVLGNELPAGATIQVDARAVEPHVHGNTIGDKTQWDAVTPNRDLPLSLFRDDPPSGSTPVGPVTAVWSTHPVALHSFLQS